MSVHSTQLLRLLHESRNDAQTLIPRHIEYVDAFVLSMLCCMRDRDLMLPLHLNHIGQRYVLVDGGDRAQTIGERFSQRLTHMLLCATQRDSATSPNASVIYALETQYVQSHGAVVSKLTKALKFTLMPASAKAAWAHPYTRCVLALAMHFEDPLKFIEQTFGQVTRDDRRSLDRLIETMDNAEENDENCEEVDDSHPDVASLVAIVYALGRMLSATGID